MKIGPTTYNYGEDVERYLRDKGLTIEDLVKQHQRNIAANGDQLGSVFGHPAASAAQATPVGRPAEKWEPAAQSMDADWSKVLQSDPSLQSATFASGKPSKRTGKPSTKSSAKKAPTVKKPIKPSAPTKTQILRDKKASSAYAEIKSANAKKIARAEEAALALLTGLFWAARRFDLHQAESL